VSKTTFVLSRAPEVIVQGKTFAEDDIQMVSLSNGDHTNVAPLMEFRFRDMDSIKIKSYSYTPESVSVVVRVASPESINLRDDLVIKPRGAGAPEYKGVSFIGDGTEDPTKHDMSNDLKRLKFTGIITEKSPVYTSGGGQIRLVALDLTRRGAGFGKPTVMSIPDLLVNTRDGADWEPGKSNGKNDRNDYLKRLKDALRDPPAKADLVRRIEYVLVPARRVLDYFPGGYATNAKALTEEMSGMLQQSKDERNKIAQTVQALEHQRRFGTDEVDFLFKR
jgi:hypothetical protein